MINWNIEKNDGLGGINKFNQQNDFDREKVLLFPFFVFAANGHRKDYLKIFDQFCPFENGIIDKDIYNDDLSNNLKI